MNVAQILRQALFDLDAVRQNSTTDPQFTQAEMLTWANQGKDRVEKALRTAKQDFGLVVMQSNDSAFRWSGTTYNPTSLQLTTTTRFVTLPPDLLMLKYIRAITSGYEGTVFFHMDASDDDFRYIQGLTNPPDDELYWDLVGERTLLFANPPGTTLDVEIGYVPRSAPMQIYTTGTVSTTQDSATVSGSSTLWVTNEVAHVVELMVSGDATAPKVVSQTSGGTWVDPSAFYTPVSSFGGDGSLTLLANWLPTAVSGRGYMLATVPPIPVEHHEAIIAYVVASGRAKGKDGAEKKFITAIREMQSDTSVRQTHDPEFAEEYEPV